MIDANPINLGDFIGGVITLLLSLAFCYVIVLGTDRRAK